MEAGENRVLVMSHARVAAKDIMNLIPLGHSEAALV